MLSFFWFAPFLEARAEIKKKICSLFKEMLFWIHVNIKWSGYFLTSKKFYRSSTLIAPIRHSAAYQNLIVFHQACCLVAGLDCRTIIIYYGLPCCCSDPQLQAYALSHPWAIMSNSAPDAVCTRYNFWRSILFLKLFHVLIALKNEIYLWKRINFYEWRIKKCSLEPIGVCWFV